MTGFPPNRLVEIFQKVGAVCPALEYACSMLQGTLSWGIPALLGDESLTTMKHKLLEPVSK